MSNKPQPRQPVRLECPANGPTWFIEGRGPTERVSEMAGNPTVPAKPVPKVQPPAQTTAPTKKPVSETGKVPAPAGQLSQAQNVQPGALPATAQSHDPDAAQVRAILEQVNAGGLRRDNLSKDESTAWTCGLANCPVPASLARAMVQTGVVVATVGDGDPMKPGYSWGDMLLALGATTGGRYTYYRAVMVQQPGQVAEMAKKAENAGSDRTPEGQRAAPDVAAKARRALGL